MAIITFKCPNCGGGLQFDPASQKYKCEYCLSEFTQEELEAMVPAAASAQEGDQADIGDAAQAQTEAAKPSVSSGQQTQSGAAGSHRIPKITAGGKAESQEAVIYSCPSCGAEIVTDETTAATFCFYCQNPVVLQGRLGGEYQPNYVLPFTVDREKTREIFLGWLKKKKFVPKAFYSEEQIEKMTGVYFPYWMYSCTVDGELEAEGIVQKTWVTGNTRYTENRKYSIVRSGQMNVDRVTRNALKKADKKLVEGVMPFDMKDIKPFSMGYLSGFIAEKRDMETDQFAPEVEQEVRNFAASSLMASVNGYTNVQVRSQAANLNDVKWDYALMPVWTLTYRDSGSDKIYYFACNGQTGKVCGKLPIDKTKLAIFFAEIFFPLFAFLMIVGYIL